MTVETATYIDELDALFPEFNTGVVDGDDHLRLIKAALKATFPNMSGAVTTDDIELNRLDGVLLNSAIDLLDNGNTFNLGVLAGQHLAFSGDTLQSKASATAVGTLALNPLGGNVEAGAQSGSGGFRAWKDGTLRLDTTTVGAAITGVALVLDNSGAATRADISVRNSAGGVALYSDLTTGDSVLRQLSGAGADEDVIMAITRDLGIGLNHNNVRKLDVVAAGVDITGILEASSDVTVGGTSVVLLSDIDADVLTLALPANTTISAFGASLVDDADSAAAQATLWAGLPAMTLALQGDNAFLFDDGGVIKSLAINDARMVVTEDTGIHTYVAADMNEARHYTGGTRTHAWTMNTGIGQPGQAVLIINDGTTAGPTVTAGTATIDSSSGNFVVKREGVAVLYCHSANAWKLTGDLEP